MSTEAQVAAFEGGQLRVLASKSSGREAVLALPLNRLLVRMVRVPPEADAVETAMPILKAASPFPDDPLTVSCELVREDARGKIVIAAALPEGAADDIGEALDAAKLSVVRIDALVFGQLRGVWEALGDSAGRRLVIVRSDDCLSVVVLDGDQPSAIRAITDAADLRREVMLSLLEAEDFGGAKKLEEIVVVEPDGAVAEDMSDLSSFAPVRTVTVGSDAALVGVRQRAGDPEALNALPESWRELLEETRFKAKIVRHLVVAGGLWLLVMAVLFGVPVAYGFMTDHQKSLSKQHQRQYRVVKAMKDKTDLFHTYSDHTRGALEILRHVSESLPEQVTLTSWDFRRGEGVRFSGEAPTSDEVYQIEDKMNELTYDGTPESEHVFARVELDGPTSVKGVVKFTFDCLYEGMDEE